jgi:hypothetical protein
MTLGAQKWRRLGSVDDRLPVWLEEALYEEWGQQADEQRSNLIADAKHAGVPWDNIYYEHGVVRIAGGGTERAQPGLIVLAVFRVLSREALRRGKGFRGFER